MHLWVAFISEWCLFIYACAGFASKLKNTFPFSFFIQLPIVGDITFLLGFGVWFSSFTQEISDLCDSYSCLCSFFILFNSLFLRKKKKVARGTYWLDHKYWCFVQQLYFYHSEYWTVSVIFVSFIPVLLSWSLVGLSAVNVQASYVLWLLVDSHFIKEILLGSLWIV